MNQLCPVFRAKALVNQKFNGIQVGDWVVGSYIESGTDAPCIIFGDGEQIEVDKTTLSQLIGVDRSNNPLYNNDIIEFDVVSTSHQQKSYGLVYFSNECFAFKVKTSTGEDNLDNLLGNSVGNQFDNSDLLQFIHVDKA